MQKYSLFIGIDISKQWIDLSVTCDGSKKQLPHIQVANSESGFKQWLNCMTTQFPSLTDRSRWLCCMEHTGVYTLRLCRFLTKHNIAYVLVDPLHLKYSLGLRRGKSDKQDAMHIARFIAIHTEEFEPSQLMCDKLLTIKNLLSLRKRLVKSKSSLRVASQELAAFGAATTKQQVVQFSKQQEKQLYRTIKEVEKEMLQVIRSDVELSKL
jgi:transposase